MATTKPAYDPVKTVEGMFNGSVTRIAYALKDPLNYAQSTRAVLVETAKKFQDALDDCEIQILDAKWYLEQKLAANKARREAKAREDLATSTKRKRDEVKDVQEKVVEVGGENAPKRVKTAEPDEATQPSQPQQEPSQQPPQVPKLPTVKSEPVPHVAQKPAEKTPARRKSAEKPQAPVKQEVKTSHIPPPPAPAPKIPEKPPEKAPATENTMQAPTFDDFTKATPHDTGNEDFNFVSMFGDPSTDMMAGAGNDMNFDMGLGDNYDAGATNLSLQDSSLNSLLPGLESYANQAGDDNPFNMPNMNSNANINNNNNNSNNNNMVTGAAGSDAVAMGTNNNTLQEPDFSLPALGPNEFDELLNSTDMNFDGSVDFDDNAMGNMENMDFDFDSMFK